MIDPAKIDSYPLQMVKSLQKAGFTTYLVGGCVRDLLLGRVPKDFDISTSARPNEIRKILQRGRLIGKRFKLILVRHGDGQYEISTFRSGDEKYDQKGRRDFNIFGTPESDARRRDFTINALFYDPIEDRVIDYVHGQEDLLRRILRSIRNPRETYLEDPIRILRALRITGKLGFHISPADYYEMVTHRSLLATTSVDRVREEIYKALKEGTMCSFVQQLIKSGVVEYIFPFVQNYSRDDIEDLVQYLAIFDKTRPFRDFDLGISIMWLPTIRRLLQDRSGDISNVQNIDEALKIEPFLKTHMRYSNYIAESIVRIFFYWAQIRQKWMLDGVPETQRFRLSKDPYFYSALQIAYIEEKRIGDDTPNLKWIENELSGCVNPQSVRIVGDYRRRAGVRKRFGRRSPGRFRKRTYPRERKSSNS